MKNVRAIRGLAITSLASLGLIAVTPAFAESDFATGAGAKPFIAYTIASVTDYGSGDEVIIGTFIDQRRSVAKSSNQLFLAVI